MIAEIDPNPVEIKMKILDKRNIKMLMASSILFASSVSATTLQFSFDGGFIMYDPGGNPIAPMSGITGSMTMDIPLLSPNGPYPGTASMSGDQPFYNAYWTAEGSITGYQNIAFGGAPAYCGNHPMCADASITFSWNGNNIPVDASFGMDPSLGFDLTDLTSIYTAWSNGNAVYFDVNSLDTDGDGVLGTAMTEGPFIGFTPYFTGFATVTGVCDDLLLATTCTTIPSGIALPEVTLSTVPVPGAAWLFGSGLLGLAGVIRRKQVRS